MAVFSPSQEPVPRGPKRPRQGEILPADKPTGIAVIAVRQPRQMRQGTEGGGGQVKSRLGIQRHQQAVAQNG